MTYLLIAWLYVSGALLAASTVGEVRKSSAIGWALALGFWPVWVLVGIIKAIAR